MIWGTRYAGNLGQLWHKPWPCWWSNKFVKHCTYRCLCVFVCDWSFIRPPHWGRKRLNCKEVRWTREWLQIEMCWCRHSHKYPHFMSSSIWGQTYTMHQTLRLFAHSHNLSSLLVFLTRSSNFKHLLSFLRPFPLSDTESRLKPVSTQMPKKIL